MEGKKTRTRNLRFQKKFETEGSFFLRNSKRAIPNSIPFPKFRSSDIDPTHVARARPDVRMDYTHVRSVIVLVAIIAAVASTSVSLSRSLSLSRAVNSRNCELDLIAAALRTAWGRVRGSGGAVRARTAAARAARDVCSARPFKQRENGAFLSGAPSPPLEHVAHPQLPLCPVFPSLSPFSPSLSPAFSNSL